MNSTETKVSDNNGENVETLDVEAINATRTHEPPETIEDGSDSDPFNPANLRLTQDFGTTTHAGLSIR